MKSRILYFTSVLALVAAILVPGAETEGEVLEQPCHFPSATIKDENGGASAGQSSSQQNGALSPVPNMSGGILVPRIVALGYVEEHAEQLL